MNDPSKVNLAPTFVIYYWHMYIAKTSRDGKYL